MIMLRSASNRVEGAAANGLARRTCGGSESCWCALLAVGLSLTFLVAQLHAQTPDLATKARHGKELIAEGKYEEAIPIYNDLVRELPQNPGPLLNLGMALHMTGQEREAVQKLQAVLKLDPKNLPARLFLGAAYLYLDEPAKAVRPLEGVVRADPGNSYARELLGEALLSRQHYEAAAIQFEKLTQLDPENPKGWSGLGRSYAAKAVQSFEDLEKVALGSPYWLVLAAESRAKVGHLMGAYYLYRQALEQMPSLRGVHEAVAGIYKQTGHPDWAATEEEREHQLAPLNCGHTGEDVGATERKLGAPPSPGPAANHQELECDYWAGRYLKLVAAARQAKTREALYWRSRAYDQLATGAFAHLGELRPSADSHEIMAKIYYAQRRCPDAAREWQESLKFSPRNPFYAKELAISWVCSANYDGAQSLLEELFRRSGNSAELNYWLGVNLMGLKRDREAVPYLERAVEMDPTVPDAHKELARAYLHTGQAQKAIPELKVALPYNKDGSLYFQLARAYQGTGQPALAKEMLKKFREIQDSEDARRKALEQELQIGPPQ